MPRILIVDDETRIVDALERLLRLEGYDVAGARDGEEALQVLARGGFDAVLLDLDMPRLNGIETLKRLRTQGDLLPVIMVSGRGTIAQAVEAVKLGAQDFVEKPVDDVRLLMALGRALEMNRLAAEVETLRADQKQGPMIATSAALKNVCALADRAAASDAVVLVTGETGVGKELVAQRIHEASRRKSGPFVRVNCAALPEALAESELFGHVRGAFTGAVRDRKGRFQLASGGTLFLDEIGELAPALQAKLLRALSEGEIEPVGGERTVKVDGRVIAATNRDLEAEVAAGRFRQDLYYRLAIILIRVPPLRERVEEIASLAGHFLEAAGRKLGRQRLALTPAARELLARYSWPGNVRELRNVIERLAVTASNVEMTADDLAAVLPAGASSRPASPRLAESLAEEEERLMRKALEDADGNVAAAARALGLERSHFHKKLKKYGIR